MPRKKEIPPPGLEDQRGSYRMLGIGVHMRVSWPLGLTLTFSDSGLLQAGSFLSSFPVRLPQMGLAPCCFGFFGFFLPFPFSRSPRPTSELQKDIRTGDSDVVFYCNPVTMDPLPTGSFSLSDSLGAAGL
ncbi:hypothetical protein LX36DRAFT_370870 [Colletotrichum falcatum]|nr:hypothetical protein LX36DRAFT_370870 [Colletotrichum falcatum]